MHTNDLPTYGILGAGSFGTALANLVAENGNALLYTRRDGAYQTFQETGFHNRQRLHERVRMTTDLAEVCSRCTVIFPALASRDFANIIRAAAPFLNPAHILIHGTKGLQVEMPNGQAWDGQNAAPTQIGAHNDRNHH